MNIKLPEMSTSRPVLLALAAHARPVNRSAEVNKVSMLKSEIYFYQNTLFV